MLGWCLLQLLLDTPHQLEEEEMMRASEQKQRQGNVVYIKDRGRKNGEAKKHISVGTDVSELRERQSPSTTIDASFKSELRLIWLCIAFFR